MNVLAQVTGVLEPENRKVGHGVLTFLQRSRSPISSTLQEYLSCMTVHDNVSVAITVSEIRAVKVFSLNVCHWRESRSSSCGTIWSDIHTCLI